MYLTTNLARDFTRYYTRATKFEYSKSRDKEVLSL